MTQQYHVMLDIETMGTGHDAAIVSIGAVKFDADKLIGDTFYHKVDLASSMEQGGSVTADTIKWWLKQKEAAQGEIYSVNKEKHSLHAALSALAMYITPAGYGELVGVWGNGVNFDNLIVASAYKSVGLQLPWSYRHDRCYRTVMSIVDKPNVATVGTAHKAVDDAEYQARCLIVTGVLK
jgi:3' exoribonuclease, RNase T-like